MELEMTEKKRIFIGVEDPLLRLTLAKILEREGCQIVNQLESQTAEFWVLDERVDLMILDKSDSWDEIWIAKLNKIRCKFAEQPILVLTAHLPLPTSFDCGDFGFCEILQKPANPAIILEKAKQLLISPDIPHLT